MNSFHNKLPKPIVDVASFCDQLEKKLEADNKAHECCVCFELFANTPLSCVHKLCPDCFQKLDTCPLCRTRFREDELIFANFDACIWRRSTHPRNYDICAYKGPMRDSFTLFKNLMEAAWLWDIRYEFCCENQPVFLNWTNAQIAISVIRDHTARMNANATNPVRRELVRRGWINKYEELANYSPSAPS
jgi:hypothetical protein